MSQKNKNNDTKEEKKKAFTVQLSFSTVTTFCVILLSCFCLTFILGVIVGRGDNPEAHISNLTSSLSKQNSSVSGTDDTKEDIVKQEVMPKEELNYSNSLKDKVNNSTTSAEAVPPIISDEGSSVASVDTQTAIVPTEQAQQAPPQAVPATPGEELLKQVSPDQAPKPSLFDFTFQVATFTDEVSVDRLRARLEGKGLRTKMEKSGKFYKVMVLMRGNNEQAQELRSLMVSMKLGEPLQRSKQAIE